MIPYLFLGKKIKKKIRMSSAAVILLAFALTLCMLSNFSCFFVVCGFFLKLTFSKQSFRNTIRMSDNLDPDQT